MRSGARTVCAAATLAARAPAGPLSPQTKDAEYKRNPATPAAHTLERAVAAVLIPGASTAAASAAPAAAR